MGDMMLNIAIVDDDNVYLQALRDYVANISNKKNISVDITVTDDYNSIFESELYKHNDVILLDIVMPNMNGIEIASKINSLKGNSDKPYIIFVTNRDGLVFNALKQQPYSFVRKSHINDLDLCLLNIYSKLSLDDVYIIKSGTKIDRIAIKNIQYIEKSKNYVIFHTETGDYRERSTIEQKANDLLKYSFVRPHIGYLINNKYIDEISPKTVKLLNGIEIPLSKKYKKELKNKYYEWIVNKQ